MRGTTVFVYVSTCYAIFLGTFVYAVGFVGNVGVPRFMDSVRDTGLITALLIAVRLNVGLGS